jgi:hypothetical protein
LKAVPLSDSPSNSLANSLADSPSDLINLLPKSESQSQSSSSNSGQRILGGGRAFMQEAYCLNSLFNSLSNSLSDSPFGSNIPSSSVAIEPTLLKFLLYAIFIN